MERGWGIFDAAIGEKAPFRRYIFERFWSIRPRWGLKEFPGGRKTIKGADNEVEGKEADKDPEPDRMVHVKEL